MRVRTAARAGLLLGGEVAALVVLHRLGSAPGFALPRTDPARWVRETPALDVTIAVARVLALAAAWWLLASTVWWLVAAGRGRLERQGAFAMPGSRRLAEWTLAVTLVGATALTGSGAGAATTAPATATTTAPTAAATTTTPTGVRTGRGLVTVPPAIAPAPLPTIAPAPAPVAAPVPAVVASVPVPELHVIAAGENLWTIAAAHVAMLTNRSAGAVPAAEVAPYWRALCDLNRATIRSGNPSLVYPGEVLRLPPA